MSRRFLNVTCYVLVVLFGFSAAQFNSKAGDSCQLKSGKTGVCRPFDECDLKLFSSEPGEPNICAWVDDDAIVCCPEASQPNVPRQPQTSNSGLSKTAQKCEEFRKIKEQQATGTIVGGEDVTSVEQYPHMTVLGYGNPPKWLCGGTLISEKFVLTAAHCLTSPDRLPVSSTAMGFIDRTNMNQFGTLQQFRVVKTYKHPTRKPPKQYADIALLELDRPVTYTNAVLPACLHEDFAINVQTARAIGFGDLSAGSRQGSDILQKVRLTLSSHEDCSNKYPTNRKIPEGILQDSQFCAGEYGKDTCQGDSGGPLQIHDTSGMARIIGITSFGQQCAVQPGVYTRVSHYLRWIESIVWP